MQTAIDLPIREGVAPRLNPDIESHDFKWPSFTYWVKAGIGLTLGGSIVYVGSWFVWWWLLTNYPGLILLRNLTR